MMLEWIHDEEFDRDGVLAAVIKTVCNPIEEKRMVDLCCEKARFTRNLPFKTKTFVDVLDWGVSYPGKFMKMDAMSVKGNWDVVLALDAIEHFEKVDGYRFLVRVASLAQINIFFTPLGELWTKDSDHADPKSHKCGWVPSDLAYTGKEYDAIVFPYWHSQYMCGAWIFWNSGIAEFGDVMDAIKPFRSAK
jgi:hypothetical protein